MGGRSELTFSQGTALSADYLNAKNSEVSLSGTLGDSADWIQDSIGNNGIIFSHRPAGTLLFSGHFRCGWFGGGRFRIYKWINGGWNETVYAVNFGWNTNTTVNAYSTGPGAYRICSETAFQFAAIPWYIYCGQTDCTRGKHLTVYDGFRSSINTLPGTLITPDLCNAQRVGTLGTP